MNSASTFSECRRLARRIVAISATRGDSKRTLPLPCPAAKPPGRGAGSIESGLLCSQKRETPPDKPAASDRRFANHGTLTGNQALTASGASASSLRCQDMILYEQRCSEGRGTSSESEARTGSLAEKGDSSPKTLETVPQIQHDDTFNSTALNTVPGQKTIDEVHLQKIAALRKRDDSWLEITHDSCRSDRESRTRRQPNCGSIEFCGHARRSGSLFAFGG